jgi:hypothetical protein
MAKVQQLDNGNLVAKLKLRRHFLETYHADGSADVLDCCQGNGVIWKQLRHRLKVRSYWGLDLKPKKGRLKLDSVRVLQQSGWSYDVIDIDTYGSPWKHWMSMLPNVTSGITVFLTIGQWQMGTAGEILEALGIGKLKVPPGIAVRLHEAGLEYLLAAATDFGLRITEAREAICKASARYFGIRLEVENPDKIGIAHKD